VPVLFRVLGLDLRHLLSLLLTSIHSLLFILLNKYADDCYLITPSAHAALIPSEIEHIEEWARQNNLKLNVLKTKEMIIKRPRIKLTDIPPPTIGIERVGSMKILGVLFDGDLNFKTQVDRLVRQCNQSLYAIRTLKAHGLSITDTTKIIFHKIGDN